jgi:hypothetical protein
MPANMKAAGIKYKKGGSKRRTVKVNTKNPAPGMVGGTPVTTKTVTKKRGNKTITKTKSVSNPMNPFAKSSVSKSKTVTKGSGPTKELVKTSGSNKKVSQKRGERMQSRMQNRKGATTTTGGGRRKYTEKPRFTKPTTPAAGPPRRKMGMGGKAPMAKDYVGNPMKYFNDKAAFGKEMARKKMMDKDTQTYP